MIKKHNALAPSKISWRAQWWTWDEFDATWNATAFRLGVVLRVISREDTLSSIPNSFSIFMTLVWMIPSFAVSIYRSLLSSPTKISSSNSVLKYVEPPHSHLLYYAARADSSRIGLNRNERQPISRWKICVLNLGLVVFYFAIVISNNFIKISLQIWNLLLISAVSLW